MKHSKILTKLTALLLALACTFALAACSSQGSSSGSSSSETTASGGNSDTAAAETSAQDGKALVVYFSATGNTKEIAQSIAEAANADLFELEPKEPYTDDDLNYNDTDSRVYKEYSDESLRDVELVSTAVENWDEYTTVFIGYPIWWGNAAWPVNGFVKANDFSGKTVIPFCSSASSELGDSASNLAALTTTGTWKTGKRFSSNADADEVKAWISDGSYLS